MLCWHCLFRQPFLWSITWMQHWPGLHGVLQMGKWDPGSVPRAAGMEWGGAAHRGIRGCASGSILLCQVEWAVQECFQQRKWWHEVCKPMVEHGDKNLPACCLQRIQGHGKTDTACESGTFPIAFPLQSPDYLCSLESNGPTAADEALTSSSVSAAKLHPSRRPSWTLGPGELAVICVPEMLPTWLAGRELGAPAACA